MVRAGLYERVSTQEQERNGLSLLEQSNTLRKYATEHGMKVVDEYVDGGISARKKYTHRPALLRLLEDVKAGKLDTILFIKLDRWVRSVSDYYDVQKVLDENNVSWQATEEDYETVTASGRFKVNIMLSVAQDEADRTSERIRFVMQGKRERNEAVCGSVPLGYMIKDKHIVIDPKKEPYVREVFKVFMETGSAGVVIDSVPELRLNYQKLHRLLRSTAYKGEYSGIEIEPYLTPTEWEEVQKRLAKPVRRATHNRIYLFSGLVFCPLCGGRMSGSFAPYKDKGYYYYRCLRSVKKSGCPYNYNIREDKIESYLLSHIEKRVVAVTAQQEEPRSYKKDREAVQKKLSRLSELYVNDLIKISDYKKQYEALNEELAQIPPDEPKHSGRLKQYFFPSWQDMYMELTRDNKRRFWGSILDSVTLNIDGSVKDFSLKSF